MLSITQISQWKCDPQPGHLLSHSPEQRQCCLHPCIWTSLLLMVEGLKPNRELLCFCCFHSLHIIIVLSHMGHLIWRLSIASFSPFPDEPTPFLMVWNITLTLSTKCLARNPYIENHDFLKSYDQIYFKGWGQSAKLQQLVDHFPSDQWKALFLLPLDQWQASIYSMIE